MCLNLELIFFSGFISSLPQFVWEKRLCCCKDSILEGKIQVVREAEGQVPVFLDSGIRRGTDVFKALALGASGVFVSPLQDYSDCLNVEM